MQVVQETMQPAHISLWLRKPQEEEPSPAKAWRSAPSAPQSEQMQKSTKQTDYYYEWGIVFTQHHFGEPFDGQSSQRNEPL